MRLFLIRYRRPLIRLCQLAIVEFSLVAAFLLRFDFSIPRADVRLLIRGMLLAGFLKTLTFHYAKLDRGWWRFVGITDLYQILLANAAGSGLFTMSALVLLGFRFPRSVYFLDFLLCFLGTAGSRFAVRIYYEAVKGEFRKTGKKGLLIYGAGNAGMTLLREIRANPSLGYDVVGFLDDNPHKRHGSLMGLPVLGAGRDAPRVVDRCKQAGRNVEEVLIAMPSASGRQMQEALANCRAAGLACKTVPGLGELLKGQFLSSQIRKLDITDLLGREPVRLEEGRIRLALAGRSVLITGAAGSIGSELCRQVARFQPRVLIALDQAESDLFRIDLELRNKFPSLEIVAQLGDIRDFHRLDEVIRRFSVQSIFHAAAYKHVPMMESHVLEAVRNNVLGTYHVVLAAQRNRVPNLLMISSDKAVNPVNVMGLTKRVAELIVSSHSNHTDGGTRCVSVRFGNVLGSNGSVVPLFEQQIAAGGPVTVTHPKVRRYFMTVREAVQLVLQASTIGNGSEIFVLDMGEPVRIVDLATNMIRLSGRVPDQDIEIRFIGLRPGEKLYEELITQGEGVRPTYHDKIKIFQGRSLEWNAIESWMLELEVLLARRDEPAVLAHLDKLVPEYQPASPPTAERAQVAAATG